jgi:hypothetical protein
MSSDVKIGRYSMRVNVETSGGVSVIADIGTLIPTIDTWGERNVYGVMPFEFIPNRTVIDPTVIMSWLPEDSQLPLQVRQVQIEEVLSIDPVPEFGGFLSWKQDCLYRAMRSVSTAYATFIAKTSAEDIPDFTLDGTLWDKTSTESWMQSIETYQPRLRHIPGITTIQDDRHYKVVGGYVVYNGGTYADGQKFWGTSVADSVLTYGGQVDQQGAFTLSFPGHIGKPAVIPLGLYYNNTNVCQLNRTSEQSPVLSVCQPWMIEAGIYVAHPDFWCPDTITTGLEVEDPPLDRYPDTATLTTGFREGELLEVVYPLFASMSVEIGSGEVADVVHSISGGTNSGTTSVEMWSGEVADVVYSVSGGTNSGTTSVEMWSGGVDDVVYSVSGGTNSGTTSVEMWSGGVAVTSVDGGDYVEESAVSGGFYTGIYT